MIYTQFCFQWIPFIAVDILDRVHSPFFLLFLRVFGLKGAKQPLKLARIFDTWFSVTIFVILKT